MPGMQVTRMLARQGIVVSAGHCDPSLDQLDAAIDAGLSMFTHLGNGCPLQMHRHDNVIQRALSRSQQLWLGFIADGVHVPFFALQNYLRAASFERCFVVTDAISAAGQGPGTYRLGEQTVVVDEQLATWAEDRSHLMGSAGTMPRTAANLGGCPGTEPLTNRTTDVDEPAGCHGLAHSLSRRALEPHEQACIARVGFTTWPPQASDDHLSAAHRFVRATGIETSHAGVSYWRIARFDVPIRRRAGECESDETTGENE